MPSGAVQKVHMGCKQRDACAARQTPDTCPDGFNGAAHCVQCETPECEPPPGTASYMHMHP